jgi:hypothetical protein
VSRALLVPSLFFWLGSVWAAEPVHFVDPHLKAVVEEALWISDPTPEDMLGLLPLLVAESRGITDLTGLEYATNLQELRIRGNRVSDLSPLSGLTNLRYLDAHANQLISDISPLAGLKNMEMLIIRDNRIRDISPLSRLTRLEHLYLEYNQISDLSPLSGLANLQGITLQYNDIVDVSPLSGLTHLDHIDLRGNPLNAYACLVHIPRIVANNPGITVEYNPCDYHRVVFSSTKGGSIEDPGEGEFFYNNGDIIFVRAQADPGFVFVGFSGGYSASDNPMVISIENDVEIRADFARAESPTVIEPPDDPYMGPRIIHVDADGRFDPGPDDSGVSDPKEDGTSGHPFDQIQEAINAAEDGNVVFVHAGTYRETVDLLGKRIQLTGFSPVDAGASGWPVIDGGGAGPVVSITRGEGSNCSLLGLVITGGRASQAGAIRCAASSPAVVNCLIVGNRVSDLNGSAICCTDSNALFVNCTIADNYAGSHGAALCLRDSRVIISNSILWGNSPREILSDGVPEPLVRFSNIAGGWPGPENLAADPLFAAADQWVNRNDPTKVVKPDNPDAVWIMGDYHLQSPAGRWDPKTGHWVQDTATSPCIDAGDPNIPVGREIFPNGLTIDMGVYGGTVEASKSSRLR